MMFSEFLCNISAQFYGVMCQRPETVATYQCCILAAFFERLQCCCADLLILSEVS